MHKTLKKYRSNIVVGMQTIAQRDTGTGVGTKNPFVLSPGTGVRAQLFEVRNCKGLETKRKASFGKVFSSFVERFPFQVSTPIWFSL